MEKPYFYERMHVSTVQELIRKSVELYHGNDYCKYIADGEIVTITYGEMMRDVKTIGTYITNAGAKRVGLLGASSYAWMSTYLACLHIGVVVVPMGALLPPDDLKYLIEHADVDLLFCDQKFSGLSEKLGAERKCKTFCYLDTADEGGLRSAMKKTAGAPYYEPAEVDKDALALIVYTSGTTGQPKGVMVSQENIAAAAHYTSCIVDPPHNARDLVLLPNNHLATTTMVYLTAMFFGKCLCINDSIYNTIANINKFEIQTMLSVPAIVRLIKGEIDKHLEKNGIASLVELPMEQRTKAVSDAKKKLGKLKTVMCGAAPLDPSYVHFFKMFDIEVLPGYGMTEASPFISNQVQGRLDYDRAHSVGRPGVCCEVKIVDGEIWVSGTNIMMGYYKNPEATAATLTQDGWLRTGDIGHLDEEGFLYVTGRIKNLIILGNGENVSPEELEMLFTESAHIKEILVSAETALDTIKAEVYPSDESVEELGLDEVKSLIEKEINEKNQNLPNYKQIKLVTFRDKPFEKTASQKIKRGQ